MTTLHSRVCCSEFLAEGRIYEQVSWITVLCERRRSSSKYHLLEPAGGGTQRLRNVYIYRSSQRRNSRLSVSRFVGSALLTRRGIKSSAAAHPASQPGFT